ncbi:hypothetical protein A5773_13005 [Mycobacterium sp. 852014-52450_SCH5900713]|uniref:hypothetical protein n=1 Tax=Mycobacterium sp. 852014-52450_SCH5900713 TaxID=1834116 RepID=UPI0007FC0FC7|nr:hypothetical protein [Mycobacterium sp. 852014-52450_SCH5900713]OBF96340.1 hypothetical protein A5773_13005 [Mycobacterium sp. 852014-52450_SCH5900713]
MNAKTHKSRLDHPRRCTAHKHNGDPCMRYAARGANVCRVHGGAAPQVVAKARERLALAADRMARELLGIAAGAESEAVKLAAVRDALDRAGLSAKQSVELSAKEPEPWEELTLSVVRTSREDWLRRRGLPPKEPPAPVEPALEVVDAELVPEPDDHTAPHASSTRDRADADDRGDEPADTPATPSRPPSRALVPLEDATADVARANRAARAARGRRAR